MAIGVVGGELVRDRSNSSNLVKSLKFVGGSSKDRESLNLEKSASFGIRNAENLPLVSPASSKATRCWNCVSSAFKGFANGVTGCASTVYNVAKRNLNTNLGACAMMLSGAGSVVYGVYGEDENAYYAGLTLVGIGFQTICVIHHTEGTPESIRQLVRSRRGLMPAVPEEGRALIERKPISCLRATMEINTGVVLVVQRDAGHLINRMIFMTHIKNPLSSYSAATVVLGMFLRMKLETAAGAISNDKECEQLRHFFAEQRRRRTPCSVMKDILIHLLAIAAGVIPIVLAERHQDSIDATLFKILKEGGLSFLFMPVGFHLLRFLDRMVVCVSSSARAESCVGAAVLKTIRSIKFLLETPAVPVAAGFAFYKFRSPASGMVTLGMAIGSNHALLTRDRVRVIPPSRQERLECAWIIYNIFVYYLPWPLLIWFAAQDAKNPTQEDRMPYQGTIGIASLGATYFLIVGSRKCLGAFEKRGRTCVLGEFIVTVADYSQLTGIVGSLYLYPLVPRENTVYPVGVADLILTWGSVGVSLANATVGRYPKHTPEMFNRRALPFVV